MNLPEAFRDQARYCEALGSPFTARLLHLCAAHLRPNSALARRLFDWPGDPSSRGASLPLRLAGGLHALARARAETGLAELYRNPKAHDDAALWSVVAGTMEHHEEFLLAWLENAPQTNEVARSAVLIAAAAEVAARVTLPFELSELGASAGLNLWWDRYALDLGAARYGPAEPVLTLRPQWYGPLPPEARPQVVGRAGVDLNPLDPGRDRDRLLAYIWADQRDRLERMELALTAAAQNPAEIAKADAIEWLGAHLTTARPGRLHLVYHTVAWQYFPAAAQAKGAQLIAEAGAGATDLAPLAHLSMEAAPGVDGAAVVLRLWPGDHRIELGRADFHGRWIAWNG